MEVFSYKLTSDTGFAPNPFGKNLTLATCKAGIRRTKGAGQWVAGWTSVGLTGDRVGEERLIFLMKVTEKLHTRDYFFDHRFQDKIPDMTVRGPLAKTGDNIYRPTTSAAEKSFEFEQIRNPSHWDDKNDRPDWALQDDDLSAPTVLVAGESYYFGSRAIVIPEVVRPRVPTGQAPFGWAIDGAGAESFVAHVRERFRPGRHGWPTQWPDDDKCRIARCGG